MSIKTEFDALNENLEIVSDLKTDYINALIANGSDITSDADYIDIADAIYNLGYESDKKSFISADFSTFPSGTGVEDILYKCKFLTVVRDAIFNALEARGKSNFNRNLTDMLNLVEDPDFGDRKNPIAATLTAVSVDTMKVGLPSGTYQYAINDSTTWKNIKNNNTVTGLEDTDYITIKNSNGDRFFGTVKLSAKVIAPTTNVTSTYAQTNGYSHIKATGTTGSLYYSFQKQQDIYYKTQTMDLSKYIALTNDSDVLCGEYTTMYLIEVNSSNRILSAATVPLNVKRDCPSTVLISTAGYGTYQATIITMSSKKDTDNKYVYVNRAYTPYYDEDVSGLENLESWDGVSMLYLKNASILTVIEVTQDNHARKYGTGVVTSYIPQLIAISMTSTATANFLETKLTISTDKVSDTNKRYYCCSKDDIIAPIYGDMINTKMYTKFTKSTITLKNIDTGYYIRVLETTSDGMIIATGYIIANCKYGYLETIVAKSEWGATKGYTKLTITPAIEENNHYMIDHGNIPVHFNDYLKDIFVAWDGTSEIYGYNNEELCTLVETDSEWRARKMCVVKMTPRPLELYDISVYSRRGNTTGYTIIQVVPAKEDGNEYRYKIDIKAVNVSLDQDLSDWPTWDGSSEILAEDGKAITVVECNNQHLARKAGTAKVKSKL